MRDAIAAARRRLPMVEVAAGSPLLGPHGAVTLLDAFEGRRQLIAYYFMWWPGRPAAQQCEGCTWVMSHVGELAYLHSRDITFAVLCQGRNTAYGPGDARTSYDESLRYRTFMGWDMPWYSAQPSLDTLLVGREHGLFHLVCYLRDGDRVFETYWTKRRGAEVLDYSYASWTSPCSAGRRNGRTRLRAGRGGARDPDPGRGSGVAAPVGVARRSSYLAVATARSRVLRRSWSRGRERSTAFESLSLTGLPERPRRAWRCYGSSSLVVNGPHRAPPATEARKPRSATGSFVVGEAFPPGPGAFLRLFPGVVTCSIRPSSASKASLCRRVHDHGTPGVAERNCYPWRLSLRIPFWRFTTYRYPRSGTARFWPARPPKSIPAIGCSADQAPSSSCSGDAPIPPCLRD